MRAELTESAQAEGSSPLGGGGWEGGWDRGRPGGGAASTTTKLDVAKDLVLGDGGWFRDRLAGLSHTLELDAALLLEDLDPDGRINEEHGASAQAG